MATYNNKQIDEPLIDENSNSYEKTPKILDEYILFAPQKSNFISQELAYDINK